MILIIRETATQNQIEQMKEKFKMYIKLAVDVKREILSGGGELHADCEQALLEDNSKQEDIWGADWYPDTKTVTFESIINVRPRQQNFSMEIQDITLRNCIEKIVRKLLKGV